MARRHHDLFGYWRYVQRHVDWKEDVRRMQLVCRLIDIAASDYPNIDGIYINTHNALHFTKEEDDNEEFHDLYLRDLRREKAYRLLWKFLSQNMQKWWD